MPALEYRVLRSLRPKRGPSLDFSLPDNKMYVAVKWTMRCTKDTRPGVSELREESQDSCALDTRSSFNAESRQCSVHLHLIMHRSLRQSYKILNYCPLNHAAHPQCHQMQRRTLTGQWAQRSEGRQLASDEAGICESFNPTSVSQASVATAKIILFIRE